MVSGIRAEHGSRHGISGIRAGHRCPAAAATSGWTERHRSRT